MNHRLFSITLLSAFAISVPIAVAADATPTEAADRQFLATLERTDAPAQPAAPTVEIVKPAAVVPVPTVKRDAPVAKKEVTTAKKEVTVASVVNIEAPARVAAAPRKSSSRVTPSSREEPVVKAVTVEVRRAIPVATTTTVVTTTQRDPHADDDGDSNQGKGFFDRLFRGEKIFR